MKELPNLQPLCLRLTKDHRRGLRRTEAGFTELADREIAPPPLIARLMWHSHYRVLERYYVTETTRPRPQTDRQFSVLIGDLAGQLNHADVVHF